MERPTSMGMCGQTGVPHGLRKCYRCGHTQSADSCFRLGKYICRRCERGYWRQYQAKRRQRVGG